MLVFASLVGRIEGTDTMLLSLRLALVGTGRYVSFILLA
jgi:hypothetical protein